MPSAYERAVREYMIAPVHVVNVDDEVAEVDHKLTQWRVSCVPVVGRDEMIAGVISHTDLLQIGHIIARAHGLPGLLELPASCVGDVMTTKVETITPEHTIAEAAQGMMKRRVQRLFVVDEAGRPTGVLSSRDVMRAVIDEHEGRPVSQFMSAPPPTVPANASLATATELLNRQSLTGVVVVEGSVAVGIFTQVEALRARDCDPATPVSEAMGYSLVTVPEQMPLHRAAALVLGTRARRVIATADGELRGILSGLHFARAAAE